MRAWAFLLSFYLVFGQIYYAHSALPAVVATARGAGVLVRSGVIAHGAGALARSSYKWCKANKVKCAGFLGGAYDLIMGDDDTDRKCWITNGVDETIASTPEQSCKKANEVYTWFAPLELVAIGSDIDADTGVIHKSYMCRSKHSYFEPRTYYSHGLCPEHKDREQEEREKAEREKKEKELWDKLKDKLSDDEITNIVNNYGDDIDIDKYCASGATCYFIEAEFEKEINNNDYDIDKVTNDNCNVRNGKIYSCPNAKKKKDRDDGDDMDVPKKDKDDEKPKKDKDDDDEGNKDGEKDKDNPTLPNVPSINIPSFCTWAKPVCDWLEWSKKPLDDDDTELNIPDQQSDSIDTSINASGSCPTDIVIQGTFAGRQFEFFRFQWSKFCQWLFIIKPIIIAMASFGAVKIVGGVNVAD